jgi:O-antigen ligase
MQSRALAPAGRRLALPGVLPVLLGAVLVVRVLSDNLASPTSRHSGTLDFSGALAVLLMLAAAGLMLVRRRGLVPAALAALWLGVWTAVAVGTRGASTETLREGVREGSVIALAVIVFNARPAITAQAAARTVQVMGLVPALIALYQLATHTGMDIGGHVRANGTFAHPDSAAMFFALSAIASLWLYLDAGRRRLDAAALALFALATVATLSIDGVGALAAMLVAIALLRQGSWRERVAPWLLTGVLAAAFLATPAGAQRILKQSSTKLAGVPRGEVNSSLGWRLHKWETLLPVWERSPVLGRGLGITTTMVGAPGDRYTSKPPHSEYVRYLVETGVLGSAILLAALALLIRNLLRRRRAERDAGRAQLGAGGDARNASVLALVVVVGCLTNAIADNTLLNSPTCYAAALLVISVLSLSPRALVGQGARGPTERTTA